MLFPCVNVPGNIPWPKGIADTQGLVDDREQMSEILTPQLIKISELIFQMMFPTILPGATI